MTWTSSSRIPERSTSRCGPVSRRPDSRSRSAEDPLLGVIRVEKESDEIDFEHVPEALDIVVVRGAFAAAMVRSPGPEVTLGGTRCRAVDVVDLVLLKLYAGGPRDAWDIAALLESGSAPSVEQVEARLHELPRRCERLWRRLRAEP